MFQKEELGNLIYSAVITALRGRGGWRGMRGRKERGRGRGGRGRGRGRGNRGGGININYFN